MSKIDGAAPHAELDLDPSGIHTLEALHVLAEISSTLADEDDLDELLDRFLGTMIRLAKADRWKPPATITPRSSRTTAAVGKTFAPPPVAPVRLGAALYCRIILA